MERFSNGVCATVSSMDCIPRPHDKTSDGGGPCEYESRDRGHDRHAIHACTLYCSPFNLLLPIVTLVTTVRPDRHHCHRRRQHSQQGTDPFCPMWLVVVCRSIGRSVGSSHSFFADTEDVDEMVDTAMPRSSRDGTVDTITEYH